MMKNRDIISDFRQDFKIIIRIRKRVTIILILIVFWFYGYPTEGCKIESPESGSSSYAFDQVKSYIQYLMSRTRTPSISIGVARGGQIVWEESFGYANREKKIPATPHTVYSLASVTKPITATGLMILVERGLVNLDKPVNFYLKDCKLTDFSGSGQEPTVAQLLHHRAGLPMIWSCYFEGAGIQRPVMRDSIKKYGILISPPGVEYRYSNLGYGITEYIIEQVSGRDFSDFMKSEIFEPLGMNRSQVALTATQYQTMAQRYLENKNISPFYEIMSRGGGGACSSLHDLIRFGMFHLKNNLPDQKKILSAAFIDKIHHHAEAGFPDDGYNFGWEIQNMAGHTVHCHGGGMPGVSSLLMLIPSENIVIGILSNGTYVDLKKIARRVMLQMRSPDETAIQGKKSLNPTPADSKIHPELLEGIWEGAVRTHEGFIPIKLGIRPKNGQLVLTLDTDAGAHHPVGGVSLRNRVLSADFDFEIKVTDTNICRHKTRFELRLLNNRLIGCATAISYRPDVYCLPFYIELNKTGFDKKKKMKYNPFLHEKK